jgi:H+/Cl- antiporter ClcA
MVVMGVVAVVAGLLAVFFPETVGEQLPETMEDALNLGQNSNRKLTTCICPKSASEMFFGGGSRGREGSED